MTECSRTLLLRELARYTAADAREAAMTAQVAAFIAGHPDCFERTCRAGHVTASAWVIDEGATHALLAHHRKLDRWLQLGGHADGDGDVRRVVLREACEESGLAQLRFASDAIYDVDVHAIPARLNEAAHTHYDIRFALIADRLQPTTVSAESHDLRWVSIAALDSVETDESVRRLARKTVRLTA